MNKKIIIFFAVMTQNKLKALIFQCKKNQNIGSSLTESTQMLLI